MPTVRRCCIVGCNTNSRKNPTLQFFQFPKTESPYFRHWKRACQGSLHNIVHLKKPVVCARHFYPKDLGGRRLVGNAVPALNLDLVSDVNREDLLSSIEDNRKYAYINAVVYEWLVRANLNNSLRGSITHGMIKDKAEQAKQLIELDSFVADNRWLNKFRETHLRGFAAKLSNNQLKPLNSGLWIPDIVKDLAPMFPTVSNNVLNDVNGEGMESYPGVVSDNDNFTGNGSLPTNSHGNNPSLPNRNEKVSFTPLPMMENDEPEDEHEMNEENDKDDVQIVGDPPFIEDLTIDDNDHHESPSRNDLSNQRSNSRSSDSNSTDPKTRGINSTSNNMLNSATVINDYEMALEYIKPVEDFVLRKENFRCIGLLSQLEAVLRRGVAATRSTVHK